MLRRPPISTRTDMLFREPTLFRSLPEASGGDAGRLGLAVPAQERVSPRVCEERPVGAMDFPAEAFAPMGRSYGLFGFLSIRVPLARSCQARRSRSTHAHQNPSPAASSDTVPTA